MDFKKYIKTKQSENENETNELLFDCLGESPQRAHKAGGGTSRTCGVPEVYGSPIYPCVAEVLHTERNFVLQRRGGMNSCVIISCAASGSIIREEPLSTVTFDLSQSSGLVG